MSVVFFDGWDHYSGNVAPGGRKWNQASVGVINTTGGRFGGGCFKTAGSGNVFVNEWGGLVKTLPASYDTIVVGMAQRFDSFTAEFSQNHHPFMMFGDNGTIQCSLWLDPTTNEIVVREGRGNVVPLDVNVETTNFVPPLTLWYYFEVKLTPGSSGSMEIRVNGETKMTTTGPFQRSGNSTVNQIYLCSMGEFGPDWFVDDLYVIDATDATGSTDFLGEVRVQTKFPDAEGYQNDFFPSTGTNNALNVDGITDYSESGDYNYSGTVGAKDLYSIGNFTVSGTIFAVQENLAFRKDDVGNRNVCTLLRTASTEYEGDSVACFSDYTWAGHIWEENPSTSSPWNLTDLNQAEFGIKVKA